MTRPDWCPQDVWDAADGAAKWADALYVKGLTKSEKKEVVEAIAAAILAERERCLTLARMVPNVARERAAHTERDKQWIDLMDQVATGIEEGITVL